MTATYTRKSRRRSERSSREIPNESISQPSGVMEVVLSRVPPSGLEGCAWCLHFDRPIDHHLVKEDRPACIEERNGCGNCPESTYRVRRLPDR